MKLDTNKHSESENDYFDVENLLSSTFKDREVVLKSFFHFMQFELKPNFSIDDVRRYYDSHLIAKQFAENFLSIESFSGAYFKSGK